MARQSRRRIVQRQVDAAQLKGQQSLGGVKRSWRHVLRDEIVEFFDGFPPLQRLAWSAIQLCGDPIKLRLRMQRQVGALREVLPEQYVGVLIRPTLPRRVRVA